MGRQTVAPRRPTCVPVDPAQPVPVANLLSVLNRWMWAEALPVRSWVDSYLQLRPIRDIVRVSPAGLKGHELLSAILGDDPRIFQKLTIGQVALRSWQVNRRWRTDGARHGVPGTVPRVRIGSIAGTVRNV